MRTHVAILFFFVIIPKWRIEEKKYSPKAPVEEDRSRALAEGSGQHLWLEFEVKTIVKDESSVRRTLVSHPLESKEESPLLPQTRTHMAVVFFSVIIRRQE